MTDKKRRGAMVAAAMLIGAACGDDGGSASSSTSGPGATTTSTVAMQDEGCTEARMGGGLTIGTTSDPRGIDPFVALGSSTQGAAELGAVYDTLMRLDRTSGNYVPHVASGLEANDDHTAWTLTLRPDVRFGNGDPLTADVVRQHFERMQRSGTNSGTLANRVVELDVPDPLTVVFHLDEAWGTFPYVLAEEAGMVVNPAVADELGDEELGLHPPAGAGVGPYVVERYVPGEEVVLRARTDYWGGPVCIEQLRFTPVAPDQALYDSFRSGEIDLGFVQSDIVIAQARDAGVEYVSEIAGQGINLLMNVGRNATPGDLADLDLRRAIAMAIDYDVLKERVTDGKGSVGSELMPPESPIWPGVEGTKKDLDTARRLVSEAKAKGWDGSLRLVGRSDRSTHTEILIAVEGMLEAVGIDIEVDAVPSGELTQRVVIAPDFDLALWGAVIFQDSTVVDLGQWYTDSPSARAGFSDPAMDAAIDDIVAAVTREETIAAMAEVQRVWNEKIPSVNLLNIEWMWFFKPEVRGLLFTRDVSPLFHDAYLDAG